MFSRFPRPTLNCKIDPHKLRHRFHVLETGPLHTLYCGFVAVEAHGFVSVVAGLMGVCLIAYWVLGIFAGD